MSRLHNSLIVDSLGNFPWRPAVSSAAGWIMKMIFNVQVATGRQEREFRAPPASPCLRHQLRTRAEGLPPPTCTERLPGATYAKEAGCRLIPSIEWPAPCDPLKNPASGFLSPFISLMCLQGGWVGVMPSPPSRPIPRCSSPLCPASRIAGRKKKTPHPNNTHRQKEDSHRGLAPGQIFWSYFPEVPPLF